MQARIIAGCECKLRCSDSHSSLEKRLDCFIRWMKGSDPLTRLYDVISDLEVDQRKISSDEGKANVLNLFQSRIH
jgi:hypothetical protein